MSDKDLTPQVPGEAPEPVQEPEAKPEPKAKTKAKPEADKPTGLPDASTVNPEKISRAVLTRQGWVVPAATPAKV